MSRTQQSSRQEDRHFLSAFIKHGLVHDKGNVLVNLATRQRANTSIILLISAYVKIVVKNKNREVLNEVHQENRWTAGPQATGGKGWLRKQGTPK